MCVLTKEKEETKWWNSEARGAPVVGVVLWRTEKGKRAPKESNGKQSSATVVFICMSQLFNWQIWGPLNSYNLLKLSSKCNIGIPSLTQSSCNLENFYEFVLGISMLGMPHVRRTCMGPLLWVRVAPKKGFLKGSILILGWNYF